MTPKKYALLVLLAAGGLAACDSAGDAANADVSDSDATVAFDEAVLARAAALDDSGTPAPLSADYDAADRPLYAFESEEAYNRAADALGRLAKWGEEPLSIPTRFESLPLDNVFAPAAEVALLDEDGRVVIGGDIVSLAMERGEPISEIADLESGEVRETLRSEFKTLAQMRADHAARIQEWDEDVFDVEGPFQTFTAGGTAVDIYYVFAHSAYRTYTGAKRANAQTEVVAGLRGVNFEYMQEAYTSDFPGLQVYAKVLTEYYGCKRYAGTSPASGRIYVNAGGVRGTGQAVTYSEHEKIAGPYPSWFGSFRSLDGEDDNNPTDCDF